MRKAFHWSRTYFSLTRLTYLLLIRRKTENMVKNLWVALQFGLFIFITDSGRNFRCPYEIKKWNPCLHANVRKTTNNLCVSASILDYFSLKPAQILKTHVCQPESRPLSNANLKHVEFILANIEWTRNNIGCETWRHINIFSSTIFCFSCFYRA